MSNVIKLKTPTKCGDCKHKAQHPQRLHESVCTAKKCIKVK